MKRTLLAALIALLLPLAAQAGTKLINMPPAPGAVFPTPTLESPTITGPVTLTETLGDEVSAQTCAGWGLTTPVGATSCTDSPLTITRTASASNLTLTYAGTQTITPGTTYEIVATYTLTAGSMSSTIGGRAGATYSTTTTMHEYFPAATTGKHIITFVAASAGTITGISVRPITNTIHASEGPVVTTAALESAGNQSGAVDVVTGTKSAGIMSVRDLIDVGSGGTRYHLRGLSGATTYWSVTTVGGLSMVTGGFQGALTGQTDTETDTAATRTVLAAGCKGHRYFNGDADAIDYSLPAAAEGLNCCFDGGGFAGVITIDVNGSDVMWLDGTALTAGYAIDSPGAASDQICITSPATGKWITSGKSGTWIDGGAD